MATRTIEMTEALFDYLIDATLREPEIGRRLREETARMPNAELQISPDQGQFMALLVEMIGARRAFEVGTFTGYSALCVALALPADGRLVACDINEEWTTIARRYWQEAGLGDKIELRLGPGAQSLRQLLDEGGRGTYDFAFLDADKGGYDEYYELALELLRPGGLITIDNMLWHGQVADPDDQEADTLTIRRLNEKVRDDPRVSMCLTSIGDGLLLARKR